MKTMERSLMESQQFKGKQSITEESFVEVEQVRASKNIGRPPTGRMIKQSTRPNLRSRSVDLLEEERCSTSCESSKSEPFTRCRTVVFENSEEFVRAGGDLMIEQLASCSSYDSLNSRVSFQIPAQESKPKRNEFLQLKKQRRGDKLSSTSSEIELFGNYNNTEYWQDYVLPRGSLTTISHNMTMGPVGQIQTALFRNKYRVALKSEKMSSKDLQKELILLKYLGNYPTILSCYGYVVNGPSLQIVYELSPYGSLDKVLRENKVQSFPLALMVAWMSDLADAMQFLHSKGIIHGDIKAENILVFERLETKLCNFHTAKSVLSDSVLSETFSALSMDDDAKDHKLISTYSADITNFFNTTHHILDGKVLKVATESTLQKTERDKYLEDSLLNRPFVEFNAASKLYYVLTSFTEFEQSNHQFHRYLSLQSSSNSAPSNKLDTKLPSKKLSEQLFALVEEFCDGDPREPLNENYKKLQRYELLIKSKIDNFVPLPPKSRLRQKLFGSSTLRRYYDIQASLSKTLPAEQRLSTSPTSITSLPATLLQHQAVYQQQQKQHQQQQQQQLPPASSLNEGFATQKVIDPRTTLTEWLIMDYQCSFAEAEEFSAYFLRNGIDSKEGVIHMLEITPNFLHKYGSNYELAGRIKEQLLNPTLQ